MAEENVKRKLAAIVYADVVGYSRLTGADEEGTHRAVAEYLDAIAGMVSGHDGRVVHYAGDAVLADFGSVVAAVKCAVAVQKDLATRNVDIPDERKVLFRIGVNLGDVIVDRDDIYGNGVNVAARLESLADPGGICVSRKVLDEVQGKVEVGFEDMGPQVVKNIAEPVQTYRVVLEKPSAAMPPPLLPDKPSIAVLPFANISDDPGQEYFVDGMTEDIITALSKFRWLFVIARNSTFTYKGRAVDIRTVSEELGVRYVLEGSVRKAGERIRVTAQLIDGSSGNHIWSERYDRNLDDIFVVQDEITETLTGTIEPVLSKAEWSHSRTKKPENLDAWDLYLRGMQHLHIRTEVDLGEAIRFFDQALALDPTLVPALSAKEEAIFHTIVEGFGEEIDSLRAEAIQLGLAAVQLDSEDPGAHYALGRAYTVARKHDMAIEPLRRAVELNPNYAWAYYALGFALGSSGQPKEALPHLKTAIRLSPHDPYLSAFLAHTAAAYFFQRQHEEAIEWARRSLKQTNHRWSASTVLIAALSHLSRFDEAKAAVAEMNAKKPEIDLSFVSKVWPISDAASLDYLIEGLREAGFK